MIKKFKAVIGALYNRINHPRLVGVVLLLAVLLLGIHLHAFYRETRFRTSRAALERYSEQLSKAPYDGNLLLRAARHHYYVARARIKEGEAGEETERILLDGLALFRRIKAGENWQLTGADFFKMAYSYYRLGEDYRERARSHALEAHSRGERSAELVILLANIHYRMGQYEQALHHYETVGSQLRDPVLIFNRGWSLRALGNPEKLRESREVLRNGYNLLIEYNHADAELLRRYRLALARVNLELAETGTAREIIRATAGWEKEPNFLTVYAEVLTEEGRVEEALQLLGKILDLENPPYRATLLFQEISAENN